MRKLKNNELNRIDLKEFKEKNKTPIIIVLDNIRSAYNVGSIFRTSDAFLLSGIYLCGITPKPPHKEIRKTALGANESVDWKYFKNTSENPKHEGFNSAYVTILDSNLTTLFAAIFLFAFGFGPFLVSKRKATTGRNTQTGASINISADNVP